ncbi:hypothetical protein FGU65_10605 [Methanoculleus sp. FWC-SCC1]|uniref:Uncharacterized protein n=1 Tax=Methanoculleus frigidifontis TaxID=2584085 RepID=A0ABT8MBN1_9EURY|nr:hypothetical protein [Methanoculleus sp. FWC-SCC1]MDN7025337.1 hypothetical protein [Methanoculleus sp. FWC-SCC1]
MSDKKEVTIGITINLENYENLRLEVEGKVESQQDADDLIAFLDGMLARLGRGDAATADRIDAYRRRVLATGIDISKMGEAAPPPAPKQEQKPIVAEAAAEGEKSAPQTPEECPTGVIQEAIPPAPKQPHPPVHPKPPEQKKEAAPAPEPAKEPTAPESKPPAEEAEAVCEVCGAPVAKSQAKLAQLFTSRTLCKKCMEQQ